MNIKNKVRSAKCGVLGALVAVGLSAFAAEPSVTVGKVEAGEPWSKITVNYTLAGVDAKTEYKVAFDVTAKDQTASVTNDAAKLTDGAATKEIDTATLFGKQVADTKAKVKVSLIALKPKPLGGVQLWEGGPYFAECNVGAEKPEDAGYYFWWGDTVGYKYDGSKWVSVKDNTTSIRFSSSDDTAKQMYNKQPADLKSLGYINDDANPVLNAAHDAATAHLGAPWRMMTKAELDSLVANCTVEWTDNWNNTGIKGKIVKGQGDYSANSIFLPAAGNGEGSSLYNTGSGGNYWSSTPSSNSPQTCYLYFNSSSFNAYNRDRCYGFPVRPVRGAAE